VTDRVLIYDDDPKLAKKWAQELNDQEAFAKHFEAEVMQSESIDKLKERYEDYSKKRQWSHGDIDLDETSVLVIDFRLDTLTTGELIAYLSRCFTTCHAIIGVNQFGINPFDLTLMGHIDSYCDVNIGQSQISNPGLWSHNWNTFRPWYWPIMCDFVKNQKLRTNEVLINADAVVVDVLHINDEIDYFPRTTRAVLGQYPTNITFRDLVVKSNLGLLSKDRRLHNQENISDDFIGRVAAARLAKWLEYQVLSGQDILVDAPHLVSRFPSLLSGDISEIIDWNKITSFAPPKSLGVDHKRIESFRYKKDTWLSKAAWFWRGVSSFSEIKEVAEPWSKEKVEFVFCENSSRFHLPDQTRQFFAQVDSPYVRRHILKGFSQVEYEPKVNLVITDDSISD
jgi:hypothetical protein